MSWAGLSTQQVPQQDPVLLLRGRGGRGTSEAEGQKEQGEGQLEHLDGLCRRPTGLGSGETGFGEGFGKSPTTKGTPDGNHPTTGNGAELRGGLQPSQGWLWQGGALPKCAG